MANCPRSEASKGPDDRVFHERLHRTSDAELSQKRRVNAEVRACAITICQREDALLLIDGHHDSQLLFQGDRSDFRLGNRHHVSSLHSTPAVGIHLAFHAFPLPSTNLSKQKYARASHDFASRMPTEIPEFLAQVYRARSMPMCDWIPRERLSNLQRQRVTWAIEEIMAQAHRPHSEGQGCRNYKGRKIRNAAILRDLF